MIKQRKLHMIRMIRMINYCFLLVILLAIVTACSTNQNNEVNENKQRIAALQDEILSLRTEVNKLKEEISDYESKEYDTLLNPNIPYDYTIISELPTYRFESGDQQFLASSGGIVSFYSQGRGLYFAALPTDASGGALYIPHEFRYEKTEKALKVCLLEKMDGKIQESCITYEYEIDDEAETMIITSIHGRSILKIHYSIPMIPIGKDG